MALRRGLGLSIAIAILSAACGSSNAGHDAGAQGSVSYVDGDGSADGSSGATGTTGTYGDDASPSLNLDGSASTGTFTGCAATTLTATLAPLDLFFMIDSSGSMDDLVAAGQSKWSAVVAAMTAFVNDTASAGLGVGLQYFPLPASGVPATCTTNAQCGSKGPCVLALCSNVNATIPCASQNNCPRGSSCVSVGYCHNDHNYLCPAPGTADCGADVNGFPLGACDVMTSSTCAFGDSCTATDYAAPAVTIASLPGVAPTVIASLGAHSPSGNTPTSAALQGAIDQASTYAAAHTGHTVVAVLATDGIPDECMPNVTALAQIAATGLAQTPSIKTFAIGVFTPDSVTSGTSDLDTIAASGGTSNAFIINASTQNVEQQFSAALASIRGAALPCTYQVPTPKGLPDFNKLNVQYTSGSGAVSTIGYVETAARCNTQTGGWYYDTDPAEGGVPSEILTCPKTCSTLKGDAHGKVNIVLGCQTVLM
jgi:hypothetical protein